MMITPYEHQVEGAREAYEILKTNALVYMAWEERVGKSLASLLVFEQSKARSCLILTKKKALDGWRDTLESYGYEHLMGNTWAKGDKLVTLTNYHQACKLKQKFDLAILDEAHSYLSAFPKPGKIWKDVYKIVYGLPLIYLSATPYAENLGQLYNQLRLSKWSPFRQSKNGYDFFRKYGISKKTRTPYGLVETYSKFKDDEILNKVDHLFIHRTRKDLNFEHEPTDILHYIELGDDTKHRIKDCIQTEMLIYASKGIEEPLDSPMKLRTTVYMLEGGVAKAAGNYYVLPNREKVDYILNHWGDTEDLAIMHNFVAEGIKLENHFKKAKILQGTRFAEGVDLSHIKHLVIYSMDFSTSRYIQRRARQANKNRKEPIEVHHLLVKGGISEAVYNSVAIKKESFVKNSFERWASKYAD